MENCDGGGMLGIKSSAAMPPKVSFSEKFVKARDKIVRWVFLRL